MINAKLCASKLLEIWRLDDKRDFEKMKVPTKELLKELGHSNLNELTNLISDSYRLHSIPDDAIKEGETEKAIKKKIRPFEKKAEEKLVKLFYLIGTKNPRKAAKNHSNWWFNFILKNKTSSKKYYVIVAYHIFFEHLNITNRIISSIICTYYLVCGGYFGHDKTNKEKGEEYLEKYWKVLIRSAKDKAIMF